MSDPVTAPAEAAPKTEPAHCGFCAKGEAEAFIIIAGNRAFICDECIAFCGEVVATEKLAVALHGKPFDGAPDGAREAYRAQARELRRRMA